MSGRRTKAPPRHAVIAEGDSVMLGSALSDPVHWHPGKVLWTDGIEVLVEQYGIAGATPHKVVHSWEYVRAFGTMAHCAAEKRRAENLIRDAERQCREVEDMAAELRRKLIELFETVAAQAIKASAERTA